MLKTSVMKLPVATFLAILSLSAAAARAQVTFSFGASSEGWALTSGWEWKSGDGVLELSGSPSVGSTTLTSPDFIVETSGTVTVTVSHRFSFQNTFDGGQFQYSTDGGTVWHTIPQNLIAGETYNRTISTTYTDNPIKGQRAFSNFSTGWTDGAYVTSVATLGTGDFPYEEGTAATFNAGDVISFRFLAGWDEDLNSAHWGVDAVAVTNVKLVPEPSAALLAGGAAAGLLLSRRRRVA